jgi:hypothetical protein
MGMDHNGKEVTHKVTNLQDGKKLITFHLTAALINESSVKMDDQQMKKIADDQIKAEFEKVYQGSSKDGKYIFKSTADIYVVKSAEQVGPREHLIHIRDFGDLPEDDIESGQPNGVAEFFQNNVYLIADFLHAENTQKQWPSGKQIKTSLGNLFTHEIGHSMGLLHKVGTTMANTWHFSFRAKASTEQLFLILENSCSGKLNQGRQWHRNDKFKH